MAAVKPKDARVRNVLAGALLAQYLRQPEATRDRRLRERALEQLEQSLEIEPDQPDVQRLIDRYTAE